MAGANHLQDQCVTNGVLPTLDIATEQSVQPEPRAARLLKSIKAGWPRPG